MKRVLRGRRLAATLLGAALVVGAPAAAVAHDHDSGRSDNQHSSAAHREDRSGRFSREHPGDERSWKEEHSGGADDSCPYHACEFNDCTQHVDNCEH
jgi:hypothetical protein